MSPVVKRCRRHRTLTTGRCLLCERDKRTRLDMHRNPQGQAFRQMILARDNFRCHWCDENATSVDYLVALVNGGTPLDASNAVASCLRCNSSRGADITNGAG